METLLGMAEQHVYVKKQTFRNCREFYRNKPDDYFEDCYTNHNGIMNVRLKDNNGDHASVINDQISGLFFSANVHFSTGEPLPNSPFGPKRVLYEANTLFPIDANLYFADFYGYSSVHYVTLVLTQANSDVDHFCQRKGLTKLDKKNNKFLRHSTDEKNVEVTDVVMVEVFYTKDLPLPDRKSLIDVETTGHGTSVLDGFSKHRRCTLCNLP